MFFGKLFKKDYGKLRDKGEAHFAAGRFADARFVYQEALSWYRLLLRGGQKEISWFPVLHRPGIILRR